MYNNQELVTRAMLIVVTNKGRDYAFPFDPDLNGHDPFREQTRKVLEIISELERELSEGDVP